MYLNGFGLFVNAQLTVHQVHIVFGAIHPNHSFATLRRVAGAASECTHREKGDKKSQIGIKRLSEYTLLVSHYSTLYRFGIVGRIRR